MIPPENDQKERSAVVFDIQRCSLHDGPGIRTTVFLKGCPLRCAWCHNPESQSFEPQWMRGSTAGEPGKMMGADMSVGEILDLLMLDRPYFEKSGGGLTISGGEPMSRFEFTLALLRAAKEAGYHTCLDTSGEAPWKCLAETLPLVDVYHYDYKATGAEPHRELTGVDGKRIRQNLDHLMESGASVILRCPMIPGINDSEEHLRAIAELGAAFPGLRIDVLPFHDMGRGKRLLLGMPETSFAARAPDIEDLKRWRDRLVHYKLPSKNLIGSLAGLSWQACNT